MIRSNELEEMWKESVIDYFKILSQHLPWGTGEKNLKTDMLVEVFAKV
jgi:hypothetical protein